MLEKSSFPFDFLCGLTRALGQGRAREGGTDGSALGGVILYLWFLRELRLMLYDLG